MIVKKGIFRGIVLCHLYLTFTSLAYSDIFEEAQLDVTNYLGLKSINIVP